MQTRIALSHASSVAAGAILEGLAESGIAADQLVLLDHEANIGQRLPYAGRYLGLQDQLEFDLSGCALLLMPEADAELELAALQQGCLLVSHAISSAATPIFVNRQQAPPAIEYTQTSLRLAGPELSCLLPVLLELERMQAIAELHMTLLCSVEFHGKAGVDELATQAVNLLNARPVIPAVFAEQIAFNLLPEGANSALISDLADILGNNSYFATVQSVNVPIFHGFAASVQIRFESAVDLEDCEKRLSALDMVTVSKTTATPISDCNQSFSCVISHLEQVEGQRAGLQFWMITDPMRYGLANNYVNVTDFLLKSFL
jgi:aspartate-semialdehyde dehydrogenase